ncbi:hypothetical protein [Turicibacter sanguinis]|jgi:hypothetical protein|uniref:hypothetical protein n=1 Tax=Turicibacter sanguinis TaxID=154288 RepID=UPI00325AF879
MILVKYFQRDYFNFVCKIKNFNIDKHYQQYPNYTKLTLPVTNGKKRLFLDIVHFGEQEKVYYKTSDNKSVCVAWDKRQRVDLKEVHFSQLYSIGNKKYLCAYDFMNDLLELLTMSDKLNGVLQLQGEVKRTTSKGKVYTNYVLKYVNIVDRPLKFERETNVLIRKNSLVLDEKNEQIFLTGYTQVKADNKTVFMPEKFVLSYHRDKLETTETVKNLYLNLFDFTDDKVISALFLTQLVSEIVVDEITEDQELLMSLGLLTEEEIKEENTYSTENTQNNVVRPLMKGKYERIVIEMDSKTMKNITFVD